MGLLHRYTVISRHTAVPTEAVALLRQTHRRDRTGQPPELMSPAEVAAVFRVDPKTVTRWAKQGRLTALKTLGGHRRYYRAEVEALAAPQIEGDTDD